MPSLLPLCLFVICLSACVSVGSAGSGTQGGGGACLTEACFGERRAAALAQAAAFMAQADPLEGWEHTLRERVVQLCSGASKEGESLGVPSDWKVCLLRGRALAEDLSKFTVVKGGKKFSRLDVLRLRQEFMRIPGSFGVWVRVEKGKVTRHESFGNRQKFEYTKDHMLAFLAVCAESGVFSKEMTFEFVTTTGDECQASPLRSPSFDFPPMLSYSRDGRCPNHILVPTTPWIHDYYVPVPRPTWESLNETGIFAGAGWGTAPERTHLAALSHLKLIPHLDASIHGRWGGDCRGILTSLKTRNAYLAHVDVNDLCQPVEKGGMFKGDVDQWQYKYLISMDGVGAVTRFSQHHKAPGVVVEVETRYEQYYTPDVQPFVTFVRVSNREAELLPSMRAALGWLRGNDAAARNMSETAQKYYERHLTTRSKLQYFQLFAGLYSGMWDDGEVNKIALKKEEPPLQANLATYTHTDEDGLDCLALWKEFTKPLSKVEHYGNRRYWLTKGCRDLELNEWYLFSTTRQRDSGLKLAPLYSLPTPPQGACLTEACFGERRAAALAQAAAFMAQADPLEGWEHTLRERVVQLCSGASKEGESLGVPSDWKVCLLRGRALAEDLSKFTVVKGGKKFSRLDVLRLRREFERTPGTHGLWVRVEKGKVVQYEVLGALRRVAAETDHVLGFLAVCAEGGVFAEDATFELVTTTGEDACGRDPLHSGTAYGPQSYFDFLPMLGNARDARCPHRVLVPTSPWVQMPFNDPPAASRKEWSQLNDTAFFSGPLSFDAQERTHLTAITGLKLIDKFKAAPPVRLQFCQHMFDRLEKNYKLPYLHKRSATDACVWHTNALPEESHKYLIAVDGSGATMRFAEHHKAPGVVVEVESKYEQYYTPDVQPFVTFVRVSNREAELLPSMRAALGWLRGNDAAARNMSETAQKYYERHLTTRSKMQYFQLFAGLYSGMWDDGEVEATRIGEGSERATVFRPGLTQKTHTPGHGLDCLALWKEFDKWIEPPEDRYGHRTIWFKRGCNEQRGNNFLFDAFSSKHRALRLAPNYGVIVPQGACLTEACFGERRAAALAQAAAFMAQADPLEGWEHTLRERVVQLCSGASKEGESLGVPSDWKVCLLRGRALAEDLSKFTVVKGGKKFSRLDVLRLRREYKRAQKDSFGVWVRVEKGKVTRHETFGMHPKFQYTKDHVLGFLAVCAESGVFLKEMTFEFMTTTGDECQLSPLGKTQTAPNSYFDFPPMLSYSRDGRCPNHILVPTTPWIHDYYVPVPRPTWESLNETGIFAGAGWGTAPERTHLAALSHLKLIPHLDASIHGRWGGSCHGILGDLKTRNAYLARADVSAMCQPEEKGGMFKGDVDQWQYKYLISMDGVGAVTRFSQHHKAPGVVVEVETRYEQYYTPDVQPFVTFVRVSNREAELLPSMRAALGWLRGNDAAARNMSETAQKYYERHLTTRSKLQYFQLFAGLYSGMWDDSHVADTQICDGDPLDTALDVSPTGYTHTDEHGLDCLSVWKEFTQMMPAVERYGNRRYWLTKGCRDLELNEWYLFSTTRQRDSTLHLAPLYSLPTPPQGACLTEACFGERRAAALAQAAAFMAQADPLEGWEHTLRERVVQLCSGASKEGESLGVPSDWKVCLLRGRALAEDLSKFTVVRSGGRFSKKGVAALKREIETTSGAQGTWLRVADGKVTETRGLGRGGKPEGGAAKDLIALLGMCDFGKASFELVASLGPPCVTDPLVAGQRYGPNQGYDFAPMLAGSRDARCPHHVLAPVAPSEPVVRGNAGGGPSWTSLADAAAHWGGWEAEAPERVHLALLAHKNALGTPCTAVMRTTAYKCALQTTTLSHDFNLKETFKNLNARNLCDMMAKGAALGTGGDAKAPLLSKYLISTDGEDRLARFAEHHKAPGVVVEVETRYEQYYTPDVQPFVTFVRVSNREAELLPSMRAALGWLRGNDAAARNMSETAQKYYERHLTTRSKIKHLELFAGLYSALWADEDVHIDHSKANSLVPPKFTCLTPTAAPPSTEAPLPPPTAQTPTAGPPNTTSPPPSALPSSSPAATTSAGSVPVAEVVSKKSPFADAALVGGTLVTMALGYAWGKGFGRGSAGMKIAGAAAACLLLFAFVARKDFTLV